MAVALTPAVDANLHVIATTAERGLFPLAPGGDGPADDEATTADELTGVMDQASVGQGLLFSSRHHGFDNRYCAAAVARYPDRFAGIANIDATSQGAPDDVAYWTGDGGLQGVRLWGGGPLFTDRRAAAVWVNDSRLDPLWDAIRSRGVPCNAQKTFPELLPATGAVLRRFSGLKLTLNNLAHVPAGQGTASEAAQKLLAMAEFPDVYVSFSADFVIHAARPGSPERQLLMALIGSFGAGRLCWSAFYPSERHRPYQLSAALVREALSFLPADDQEQILGGAARSLYPCLAAPSLPLDGSASGIHRLASRETGPRQGISGGTAAERGHPPLQMIKEAGNAE